MPTFTYQPALRPDLPHIFGPKEYQEERALFIRIDEILTTSGLEAEFIALASEHHGLDSKKLSAKQSEKFCRYTILALRSNIARHFKGMDHRDFCVRLADSPLLQWFLQIGHLDKVKTFAKSTSDRFSRWISETALRSLNDQLIAHLTSPASEKTPPPFDLQTPISFDHIYFDSTCLKAPIHFPVDWVLLRDATRTLMKATLLIRQAGLRHRMPQEPLHFLSDINTLCMKMTAKNRTKDGKKQRKAVLREMKTLTKRISKHAEKHLKILTTRSTETDLTPGQISQITQRIENILAQLPAAIKQAHERLIGERKLPNKDKILSLYDPDVQVIVRGKSGAEVEFGNNLWLGETREGLIVDYLLEKEKTSDAKQIQPAIERLVGEQKLPIQNIWGDRGLHSAANETFLENQGIRSGICPKNVSELSERLQNEPGLRAGLKRRAGTEARISILIREFMGKPARAKGFAHRALMVGWAVMSHNLWVIARLEKRSEEDAKAEIQEQIPEAA